MQRVTVEKELPYSFDKRCISCKSARFSHKKGTSCKNPFSEMFNKGISKPSQTYCEKHEYSY